MDATIRAAMRPLPSLLSEWTALLAGPVGWSLQFISSYAFALAVCYGCSSAPLHIGSIAGLVLSVGSGVLAYHNSRVAESAPLDPDDRRVARAKLMASVGMMTGALFTILIFAQWLAIVFLRACPP
jgi:cation transporter-like permease